MITPFLERDVSYEQMSRRVARFAELEPLEIQRDQHIPQDALDIVYSRKLLPVIGLEGNIATPVSSKAPILGAGGITITYAVAAPGQGPDLHAHKQTFETFTVMRGAFEIRWGDRPDQVVVLNEFDTISVPPGVYRAFRNTSDREAMLQVVISGGKHDMNDIHLPRRVTAALKAASPELYAKSKASGITFEEEA